MNIKNRAFVNDIFISEILEFQEDEGVLMCSKFK